MCYEILEMGREWVAGGLRPDIKQEAAEKRVQIETFVENKKFKIVI